MFNSYGLLAGLTLVFLAPAPDAADPAKDPKAAVERAQKAMGGSDKLAKLPATTFKCAATADADGHASSFTGTWSVQLPDKYRVELQIQENNRMETGTVVVNGDKAWAMHDNRTEDAPEEAMAVLKGDFSAIHLAHCLVPLTEKTWTLAALGETKIDKTAAYGIKITRKSYPDIDLYFAKDTGLPLQAELKVKEDKGGAEVKHTFQFRDYKETDGVKHFTKIVMRRDDKDAMTMDLTEVKRLDKLDAKLFDKP
jgi:hypothetical protein